MKAQRLTQLHHQRDHMEQGFDPHKDVISNYSLVPPICIDPVGRLLKIGEVMEEVSLSRAQIYRLIDDPVNPFPKPIKIGSASRWACVEVVQWKKRALAQRDNVVER